MTAATMTSKLTPVAEGERSEILDVLRGFALFGILLVNFWGAAAPRGASMYAVDKIVNETLDIAISGSFYPLFSFLFGLGFALQLLRARERGSGVVMVYLRRMMALLIIGAVHAVVIWNGDILLDYAIIGLLLIPLHRLSDRWLVLLLAVLFAAGVSGQRAGATLRQLGRSDTNVRAVELEASARNFQGSVTNSLRQRIDINDAGALEAYRATLTANWQAYSSTVRNRFSRNIVLSDILQFFIIGLIVGRRRWLQEFATRPRLFAWTAGVGATAALAGNIVSYTIEPTTPPWSNLTWAAQNYGLTFFYISVFVLAFVHWPRLAGVLRTFAAPGRIGLTNYVMQSIVMTLIFAKYGLRIPEPGTTVWVVVNVAFFFALQVPFSRWWVPRYRFGPAEWAWRSMTYGELQPMRRTDSGVGIPYGATGAMMPESGAAAPSDK